MPSISDRLKSLGVKVGTSDLPTSKPSIKLDHPIDSVLAGEWQETPQGEVFVVETRYPADLKLEHVMFRADLSLDTISQWAREPLLSQFSREQFAYFDTETTGLAGGSGTYTFLVGIGRFEGEVFRLAQYFLSDPAGELAQLAAIEEFLSPCEALVSFNGKSFDLPLLNTRFITNGSPSPLTELAHIDLLHLARRLWKARLPSRTLGDLETNILGTTRMDEDVPGWMVPDLYFDYLLTGDARPLLGVFYHNEMDVISLARLLNHMAILIEEPFSDSIEHVLDQLAVAKLYGDLGNLERAADIFQQCLIIENIPDADHAKALEQLSFIHKRLGNQDAAIKLWKQASEDGQIYAHVELAKVYEHKIRDYALAIHWTEKAINLLYESNQFLIFKNQSLQELEHRLNRLERKLKRQK